MTCRIHQRQLIETAGAVPPGADAAALATHLARCADCREIAELLRTESHAPVLEPPAVLSRSVIEHTSGSPCSSLGERLCAMAVADFDVDDANVDDERELLAGHLQGCGPCAALAEELVALPLTLALWREFPLDERFTAEVLAATSAATRPVVRRSAPSALSAWRRILSRPRMAWEFAYVLTLLFWFTLGTIGTVSGAGGVERLAQAEPAVAFDGLRQSAGRSGKKILQASGGLWSSAIDRFATEFDARARATAEPRSQLHRRASELGHATRSGDWRDAGRIAVEAAEDIREIASGIAITNRTSEGDTHEHRP